MSQDSCPPIKRVKSDSGHLAALLFSLLAATSCGDSPTGRAVDKAASAASEAVTAEARALAKSAQVGIEAAKTEHAEKIHEIEETRDVAVDAIDEVIDAATSLIQGTRGELIASSTEQFEKSASKIAALQAKLESASTEVKQQLQFHLAALKSKRSLVETKLARLSEATADSWQALAPELNESLGLVDEAIASTEAKFNGALARDGEAPESWFPGEPAELFGIVKVVDGDTIHIMRNGEKQKLRLLSVDTEEKLSGRKFNASKPETLFGEETKLWAIDYFNNLANEDGMIEIGVLFPQGEEAYDVYGRLLCHVVLPNGDDFNLKLVKEGWSPYFTKYGYSRICHDAFLAAEKSAQEKQLGIWNPDVNKPASSSEPWNKRDYDRALPWWRARGQAIEAFRQRQQAAPDSVVSAEDELGLASLEALGKVSDYPKTVFGAVDRAFEESDGSLTLLFRAGQDQRAFRAKITKELRPKMASFNLETRGDEGVQNYLFVSGKVVDGPRGFDIVLATERALSLAAPDPVFPKQK